MSTSVITIRNERTGKEYEVTKEGWDEIGKKNMQSRFVIVSEKKVAESRSNYIPDEIQEEVNRKLSDGKTGDDVQGQVTGKDTTAGEGAKPQ